MTQVLELGTVATSNNRQRRHCQSQWAQLKPSLIAVDTIDAIIVKHQSTHKMSFLLMQWGEPWQSHKAALPTNATKASWERCEYHNDTHPVTTIIVEGASIAAMQAHWTQPRTRRSSKRKTSGRLGIFMPQISRNKNVENNNKTRDEELVKKQ